MSPQAWFTLVLYLGVLAALAYTLAIYMARIANPAPLGGIAAKLEQAVYRAAGVDATQDMPWTRYAVALLLFNAVGVAVMLAVFAHTAGLTGTEFGIAAGTAFVNQKLLEALFGERAMEELVDNAARRLDAGLSSLFARERERFDALAPDASALRGLATELRAAVDGIAT